MSILLSIIVVWSILGLFLDWYFPAERIKCPRDGLCLLIAGGPLVWLIYLTVIGLIYLYIHYKL